jgi:hypothetical protein
MSVQVAREGSRHSGTIQVSIDEERSVGRCRNVIGL